MLDIHIPGNNIIYLCSELNILVLNHYFCNITLSNLQLLSTYYSCLAVLYCKMGNLA